jgi:hypothetical protein
VLREQVNKGENLRNIKEAVAGKLAFALIHMKSPVSILSDTFTAFQASEQILACESFGDGAASCVDLPKKGARRYRKSQQMQRRACKSLVL